MKRAIWIAVAVLCIAICLVSGTFLLQYYLGLKRSEQMIQSARTGQSEPTQTDPAPTDPENPAAENWPETVQIPVDFDAMREINPDIYAWIVVPGTNIDYPVLQNDGDDLYYNTHGADGKRFLLGAVFSQKTYNSKTFSDPMTLLYGHSTVVGQPGTFVDLNSYADQTYFDQHRQIIVYTPDAMYVYTVYAACNHSKEHILYYYHFEEEESFRQFFETFYDSSKSCDHIDPDALPRFGDKLLTLSTCYAPDKSQRYLVYGVLTNVIPAEK